MLNLVWFLLAFILAEGKEYCKQGEKCWPTSQDIQNLYNALDPALPRKLNWTGGTDPRITAVPIGSPGDQPLYGYAVNGMKPLNVRVDADS